jgi:LPPG:FO 2-phospho-L-lactate transferase
MRTAISECHVPVIAISPIIGGNAVKGPTVKMLAELGHRADAVTVAQCYDGLLDGYVMDRVDAHEASRLDMPVEIAETLMVTMEDRDELARIVIAFAERLAIRRGTTAV